jgi:serine/threonine-protein kinase
MAHVSDIPDPLPAAVPVELRDLVMALLAKDPADRPPAAEVSSRATALRAGVSAHTVAMPQPTKVLPSAVAESVATGATSSRRRGWYLLAGGMAGVLLLALVIAALTGPAVTKLQAPTSTNRTPAAKTASTVGSHPGVRIVESRYIGMTAADAMTVLRAIGVVPTQVRRSSSLPAGTVIGISPHGRVARGSAVKVYVAKAEAPTPPQQLPPGQAKKVGHGGPGPGGHGHDGKGGTPGG